MLAFIWGVTKLCHVLDCWKSSLFFLLLSFYIFCINEIAIGEQLKSWPIAKIFYLTSRFWRFWSHAHVYMACV